MKRKLTLRNLLMAVVLGMGVTNAWADGTKRMLDSQNYETASASDWTCPNGDVTLQTGDETYGKFTQATPSGSGNRSCYKSVTFGYDPDGYTTSAMTVAGYNIEFDFLLRGGNVVERSVAQLIVPTTGPNLATNAAYTGNDYIFALTQPSLAAEGVNEGVGGGKTGTALNTWYVNDLTNATATTLDLDRNTWYHLALVVTATSVDYTITNNSTSTSVATGSMEVSSLPRITGFFSLLGRGNGMINFDNLEIYDFTEDVTVSVPTFSFKNVDGINRVYTLSNPNGEGTLFYTTDPSESAPEIGDAAYTSSSETSIDVTYSESGNYYAYVLHTNGTTTSPVASQAVTAGALTLATPVFTVTDMVQAADGFYYPQITFTSDNTSLEGSPTATFDITAPYIFTETGSVTVTASAEGYTSSSNTFSVLNPYFKSNTIDFGAMTAEDFDETLWTSATGAPRDYWTNRAAEIPADVTYFKLSNVSGTKDDPDNSGVLEGITISNYYQRTPQVYIGYGLLTPYETQSGNSNYMNFTVNDATEEDYIIYNGWNNYGSGTFNTVQAGDKSFGLYRYDTMLRTINVYSPVLPANIPITAVGIRTYCDENALDFSGVEGLRAYIITGVAANKKSLILESVTDVPAETGLILFGDEGTYEVPVIASSTTDVSANLLIGVLEETPLYGGYVLMTQGKDDEDNDVEGVGFYLTASATAAFMANAHTAYLPFGIVGDEIRSLSFGGNETGIQTVGTVQSTDNKVYNLGGQRVNKLAKGLYIVNGMKVVVNK